MTLPKYGTIISLQNEGRLCSCIDQPFPPTTPTHTPRLTHSSLKNAQPLTMCTTFTIPTNIRLGLGSNFQVPFSKIEMITPYYSPANEYIRRSYGILILLNW